MNKKVVAAFVIMVIVACAGIFGYYLLNRYTGTETSKVSETSQLGKLLNKNLEDNYPATPREVVKLYNKYNMELYNNEDVKDKDFEKLVEQMRVLFDDELLEENNFEEHLQKFREEKEEYKKESKTIVSYNMPENSAIENYTVDGKEMASLSVGYMLRESDTYTKMTEEFVLRQDADGKWKIVGWYLEAQGEDEADKEKKED